MPGFAWPKILFEIDMAIDLADTAPRQRFRKFHTDTKYKDGQKLGTKFCKTVRAGNQIYLRGQTGTSLDGAFVGPGDAGAQADQAMKNITTLLKEDGGSPPCPQGRFRLCRSRPKPFGATPLSLGVRQADVAALSRPGIIDPDSVPIHKFSSR